MNWGEVGGQDAILVTISDGEKMSAKVSNYGARLIELWQPDRNGFLADIVLGHDRPDQYDNGESTYFGATCGRYGNRIRGACFVLGGELVEIDRNEGENHLHGGRLGFDKKIWELVSAKANSCKFKLHSTDGDMGYPGSVDSVVTYEFVRPGVLDITMSMTALDRSTVGNLVHHSYFNLAGHGSGTILDHQLMIAADYYLPVDDQLIPTGKITHVEGTDFDFRQKRRIGENMPATGFDHNFCLNEGKGPLVVLSDPASGRSMQISTNQPGLQFYSGTYLPVGLGGKSGATYGPFSGMALETQIWPDSPNRSNFPGATISIGETNIHKMKLKFSAG